VRVLLAVGAAVVLAAWFVPASGMQGRFDEGVSDVRTWFDGGNVGTRVGTRLELWKGASMLIAEHPLLGMDFSACRARLAEFAREGRLDPVVLTLPHLHNDALQELAKGGVVGFALWAAILAAPLVFFARALRAGRGRAAVGGRAGRDIGSDQLCELRPDRSDLLVDERQPVLCAHGVRAHGLLPECERKNWITVSSSSASGRS
jgi:O-antigen ligase